MVHGITTQLCACVISDFLTRYNNKWREDWTLELAGHYVNIFRRDEYNRVTADGHFMAHLFDFCREHFDTTPCVSAFNSSIIFYI